MGRTDARDHHVGIRPAGPGGELSCTAMIDERRQCPECRFDVGPDDSACPFCGVVLTRAPRASAASRGWGQRPVPTRVEACPGRVAAVGTPAEPSRRHHGSPPPGKQLPGRPVGGTVVGAMIAAFALIVLVDVGMPGRRGARGPLNPPRVEVGDRAVLACKGGDGAYVAFGIEAWSRMAHAQGRRNVAEMHRLADTGRIALIADGTPVEVIGSSVMALQLRILAGPYEDREGWVRKEFVRPARHR